MEREEIVQEIYTAVRRANELLAPDHQLTCAEDAVLYGPDGGLDSLGLVSLILDVEAAVNARLGTQLVLADERAMMEQRNPFRDVRSFAAHVARRLEEVNPCPTARSC